MKKSLCAVLVIAVTATVSAQVTNPAPAAKAIRLAGNNWSDSGQIRTAVNGLLGWQVGISSTAFPWKTFTDSAVLAEALGLASIEGNNGQKVAPDVDKNLDYNLSPAEIATLKDRLDELRLRMPAYRVDSIPSDDESVRKLFAFAKEMSVETIITNAMPSSLSAIDRLAGENGVNVAVESTGDPKSVMHALEGLSPHVGVSVSFSDWMKQGIEPVDGLAAIKDRLMAVALRDRSALGPDGRDVRLGTGVADLQNFLYQVARLEPPPQEQPDKCVDCSRPYGGTRPLFIALDVDPWQVTIASGPELETRGATFDQLSQAADDFEKAARPAMGYRIEEDARLIPPTSTDRIPAEVKQKIEAALPKTALVAPKKPRKLLVMDLCSAGAFYHDTAAHANFAIQKMADATHAYQAIFSNDPNNLKYPKILDFDAVFLNGGTGEIYSDPDVLNGLLRFVHEGGGVAGLHGASYASMDLPQFGELLGAQDGPHHVETATLKIDDPDSPLTKQFAANSLTADFGGKDFVYTDEFYHFLPTGPYSRSKLHVLISIDAQKTDLRPWHVRPDNDYGLVWIKSYGKGRVFNCALGHTPTLFETPALAQMILNGIQFVLGDLPADTTPTVHK